MKNAIFTSKIIRAIFLLTILIFSFINTEQIYFKLLILTFLLLTICNIIKNIFYALDKINIGNFFHKIYSIIFIVFAIIFLLIWFYIEFSSFQYFYLIIIIFLIFIGYMARKYYLKVKKDNQPITIKNKFSFKIIVSSFLVITVLLVGIICLFLGIKDTYSTNKKTKNYIITDAYYSNYELYENSTTYRLIYFYKVNDTKYTIKTDYGTGSIPNFYDKRQIKYNPDNPSEAIFLGTNKNSLLICFGAFFILGGMTFVLVFLYVLGVFNQVKINVLGLYVGIVSLIIGIGIICIQLGEVASLIRVIEQMKFWFFIPILFIIVGIFQIIKCLFFERLDLNNKSQEKLN